MLDVAKQGTLTVPAMLVYNHKPKNIEALVDFVVGRILDTLGIENAFFK